MMKHTRVRIVNGKVEEGPLQYSGGYSKAQGWTDVRIAEIPRAVHVRSELVHKANGTVPSIGKELASKHPGTAILGVNASFVSESELLGKTIIGEKVVFPDVTGVTEKRPHFYCRNGTIGIGRLDDPKGVQWAVCAMTLIRGGKYVFPIAEEKIKSDVANGIRARTAAGLKPDGTAAILLVDEGGSDRGMTQREVADYLLSLGCTEAVVLDGGGSSTGYTNDAELIEALDLKGGTHVCETGKAARTVAHCLAFFLDKTVIFPKSPKQEWKSKSPDNVKVIDVSHHQGTIDWPKVAADGVKGTLIKASEGAGYVDPQFRRNAVGAVAVGLPVGFYHYARPENNSAAAEAAHFIDSIKGLASSFPVVLDVEGEAMAAKVGGIKLTAWCLEWLQAVEKAGYKVMLYTGASFAKSYLGMVLGVYPLWVAHYGVDKPMSNNTWVEWSVFQYSDSGKVNGIAGNVDLNVMEKAFYDKYVAPPPKAAAPNDVTAIVFGKKIEGAVVIDGVTMLPLRAVSEAIGGKVTWDQATKTATIE